jgi:ATP-dependent Lon protease
MTGEVTLRGRVLPIGGLKEKILAAHRGHITTVILPQDNAKDIPDLDLPQAVRKTMTVHHVEHMDQVLELALEADNTRAVLAGRVAEERTVEAILGLPAKPAVAPSHTPENPAIQ